MNTLLLTSINYVLQLFLVLTATIGSSYFNNSRTYWMAGNLAIAVTGAIMVRQLPVDMKWGRLAGICMAGGYAANFPLIMSLMSGNFGGFTKKTTVNAMVSPTADKPFLSFQQTKGYSPYLYLLQCTNSSLLSQYKEFYGVLHREYYWTTAFFCLASANIHLGFSCAYYMSCIWILPLFYATCISYLGKPPPR